MTLVTIDCLLKGSLTTIVSLGNGELCKGKPDFAYTVSLHIPFHHLLYRILRKEKLEGPSGDRPARG